MVNKILEVKNINKFLSWKHILKDVSFEVLEWEMYWFLWPNWAWKTTTMKSIMWLIEQEEWEIIVLGQNWLNIETKKQIGFMPENTYLYKYLTWREFLEFNWKFFWLNWDKLKNKIEELLKKVWLEEAWNKYLYEYSKWMLQRIGLAQSIINDPKLLFLDEPMSWLDPIWRKMVKDLLVELKQNWTTIFNKWEIVVQNFEVSKLEEPLEDFFIKKVSV